jgi:hypothetical protein
MASTTTTSSLSTEWVSIFTTAIKAIDSMPGCVGVYMDTPHGESYIDRATAASILTNAGVEVAR